MPYKLFEFLERYMTGAFVITITQPEKTGSKGKVFISKYRISKKKKMPFKLFEFLERYMTGAFLITITQPEKTGSIGKVFIPLEIKKLNSTFEIRNLSRFLRHFHVRFFLLHLRHFQQMNFN